MSNQEKSQLVEGFTFRGTFYTVHFFNGGIGEDGGYLDITPYPTKYVSQIITKSWKTVKATTWWTMHKRALADKEYDRKEAQRARGAALMTNWRDEYTGEVYGNPNQTFVG